MPVRQSSRFQGKQSVPALATMPVSWYLATIGRRNRCSNPSRESELGISPDDDALLFVENGEPASPKRAFRIKKLLLRIGRPLQAAGMMKANLRLVVQHRKKYQGGPWSLLDPGSGKDPGPGAAVENI